MSRDRDRILEQALKHELSAVGTPPAGAPALRSFSEGGCLDAETLGAWTDGGLDAAAMAAAEAHVSNCARCQALVGAMGRSASTLGTVSTAGTLGTQGTLSLWRWWLAPIAAGVTAVTLWTVIPEQQQVAVAPPQAKSNIAVPPPAALAEATPPAEQNKSLERERTEARDNLSAAARADQAQLRDQALARDAAAPKEEAAKLADSVTAQRQESIPAAPAAPTAPAPAAAPPATTGFEPLAGLQKSARSAAAIEIATLDPSLGWRIVGDRIERSEDGGRTWRLTRQNPDGITAGSAPSNSVCWFVGRAGRVLLTTNGGATFGEVALAEPLDLASVAATDARSAMVYSVIGRRFRTQDGGRTWLPF